MRRTTVIPGSLIALLASTLTLGAQSITRIDSVPQLRIDLDNSSDQVHEAISVVRLARNRYAVADAHGGTIHLYDLAGRFVRSVGRAGAGPGEFRHIAWLGRCSADSAFAYDRILRKFAVITAEGGVVREFSLQRQQTPVPAESVACSAAGMIVTQGLPSAPERQRAGDPIVRGRASVSIAKSDGSVTVDIPGVQGGELVVLGGGAGPLPLGKTTRLAAGPQRVAIGTNDSASLGIYDLAGTLVSHVQLELPPIPSSDTDYQLAIDELLATIPASVAPRIRQQLTSVERPRFLPFYEQLLMDGCDRLFVSGPSAKDHRRTRIAVFLTNGTKLHEVTLSANFRPTDVGRDYIVGLSRRADGGLEVLMYQIRGDPLSCA